MPPYTLANFEIQKYYQNDAQVSSQNESKFNGVYSRNDLPKTKDGAYAINLHVYKSIETYWIALYVDNSNVNYFERFGVVHIPKEVKNFIGNKKFINKLL